MVKLLFLLSCGLSLTGLAAADEVVKPRCTGKLERRFWPDRANDDPKLAIKLARTGELELCSSTTWSYRWIPASIRIHKPAESTEAKTEPKSK